LSTQYFPRILTEKVAFVDVGSRIYLYNPDAEESIAPEAIKHHEEELREAKPEVNVWSCIILLIITIVIMGFTAELVS
jgi:Ca2+:H+ antiporter